MRLDSGLCRLLADFELPMQVVGLTRPTANFNIAGGFAQQLINGITVGSFKMASSWSSTWTWYQ